jgi:PAS domain S-box-containing protein
MKRVVLTKTQGAMEEHKYSELTFQLIVESSPSAIVLVNQEGKIAYVNSQMEKLFGYQRSEIIGHQVEVLIPDRFTRQHPKFLQKFFQTPSVRAMGAGRELYAKRKDNSEFPIEIGLNPLVTVNGTLTLASIIDITERKSAEEQFRLVVESAPNAIVLVNRDGTIRLVNRQTEELFGYSRDELVGGKIEKLIPPRFASQHPDHRNIFFGSPKTRSMGGGRDLFALRRDGTEVQVEIGLNPIETPQGILILASIVDITERKQLENIAKRKLELESRNKELEQFAYIASHDLQEPLRTVTNYMDVFEEDYGSKLDDQARKFILSIKSATERMRTLVGALLDFSRLGRGKVPVKVDIKNVIDGVCADIADLIQRTKSTIHVGKMPELIVYETEMQILFQNLITNAIKFRKAETDPVMTIEAKEAEGWLFEIRDNGIGIASHHLNKIFEIFQRLHTNQEFKGNGIGLASSKRIVELHGGKIWAESKLGEGTSIFFTFPQNIPL